MRRSLWLQCVIAVCLFVSSVHASLEISPATEPANPRCAHLVGDGSEHLSAVSASTVDASKRAEPSALEIMRQIAEREAGHTHTVSEWLAKSAKPRRSNRSMRWSIPLCSTSFRAACLTATTHPSRVNYSSKPYVRATPT